MPYRVEISSRATEDLATIYGFIQSGESLAAERWFAGLKRAISSLSESPYLYAPIPGVPALRQKLYGHKPYVYRIVFSIDADRQAVMIRTIRHGARSPLRR
jgi:plasmid stabilization system protein ParE